MPIINLWGEEISDEAPVTKVKAPTLFDCINDITSGRDFRKQDPNLKAFDPFMVGKALMQNESLIGFACMLNQCSQIPKEIQFLFYHHAIPSGCSRVAWGKKKKDDILDRLIKFGYSVSESSEMRYVFTDKQLKLMLAK